MPYCASVCVHSQGRDILAEPWIPKFDEQVFAPTDDQPFPRMPLERAHVPSMPTQYFVFPRLAKRPHLDRPVVPARRKFFIRGTETDRAARLAVGRNGRQVVDGRCKVFQRARVVGGEEEGARVGVSEGVDGVVVGLLYRVSMRGKRRRVEELACLRDSKLYVPAFHIVNWPIWLPVKHHRPSGFHCRIRQHAFPCGQEPDVLRRC